MTDRPIHALMNTTSIAASRSGAAIYVLSLVGALAARPQDVALELLAQRRDLEELRRLAPGAAIRTTGVEQRPRRLAWEHLVLPLRIRRIAPDLVHGPHYTLPDRLRPPGVVTFHDPTFFTMPEVHERSKIAYFTRMARAGIRRASRVIAVSEYARRGAIEHAGADPDRVDVTPLGVDRSRFRPPADDELTDDERERTALGVTDPYILWVGAIEPRKDVPTLVRAFASLVAEGADLRLVLAGPRAWGADEAEAAIASSGVSERIALAGYVSERAKVALYRGAAVFAYPSLAEGFGLPVLEAMACGTPVVTTAGSAMEEFADGVAEFVAPAEANALASAIRRVVEDPALARELGRLGTARAAEYGWDRTAAATLLSYRGALGW